MVASAPHYGMYAPKEMLELARRPGYLKERAGGNRLRELWNDEMQKQFDPRKLPYFAFDCCAGMAAHLHKQMLSGKTPDLNDTLTEFRLSYVTLLILGAQRLQPGDAATARDTNHVAALELLLSRGANPNIPAINGATPLHFASAIYGRPDLVRILLKHGADVNARDRYGQTPIFDAMLTDEVECVDALMEAGADVNIPNADGMTALAMKSLAPQVTATVQRWLRKRAGATAPAFERKVCDGCQKKDVPLSLCSRCHTARYCSRDCQRAAWKAHKASCTSFNGPTTLTIRPSYSMEVDGIDGLEGMPSRLISMAPMLQNFVGKPTPMQTRNVKPPSESKVNYPKPMIVKIQAPMGPSMTSGMMLVYDKRREFVAYLNPSGGRDSYLELRKIIAERGVSGGLKAYFAAELVSKDELTIKSEVLAPQEF